MRYVAKKCAILQKSVIEKFDKGFNGEFNVGTARVTNDLLRDNKNNTALHVTNFQSDLKRFTVDCGCCVRQNEN